MKRWLIILFICAVFFLATSTGLLADDLEHLRSFEHPFICKPILNTRQEWIEPPAEDWITLSWKQFITIGKDKLLFRHEGTIATVPMDGFVCEQ